MQDIQQICKITLASPINTWFQKQRVLKLGYCQAYSNQKLQNNSSAYSLAYVKPEVAKWH